MKKKAIFLMFLVFNISTNAQEPGAWVTISKDTTAFCRLFEPGNDIRYTLKICYVLKKDTFCLESIYDWDNNFFKHLNDSIKLVFIEGLLKYEGNILKGCGHALTGHLPPEYECMTYETPPYPKDGELTIEVEALYRINTIAFPYYCMAIACKPAIYDRKKHVLINSNTKLVRKVYNKYKKWFKKCKRKHKILWDYPFNNGRYRWFQGFKPPVKRNVIPNR